MTRVVILAAMVVLVIIGSTPAIASQWGFPVDRDSYFNWYQHNGRDRTFYYDGIHLGEDVDLPEDTPIRVIGDGTITIYQRDGSYPAGFGELYAVIEHNLGQEYEFTNGFGQMVRTSYIRSIYGHIRKNQQRGGQKLSWQVNNTVRKGDVIGYINDDAHNGDGSEHLHMGIILDRNSTSTPFGYDWSGTQGGHFAAPSEVISLLMVGLFPDGQDHGETDLFRQAYSDHGGYQMFGAPWDNGRGLLVHCWPDECDHPDVLLVQDFLRSDGYWSQLVYSTYINEVVPVHGAILEYWNSHWGYSSYGAPLVSEYAKTINGEVWHVQDFQRDQDALVRTIGYNPETLEVGEVIPDGRGGFWIALGDDDDDDLPLPSIPCLDPISASQQGLENFYSGMILNGQADICAAYGWQAFYANGEAFLSHCCSQGELTINNGNCVIAAVTRQAGNRYHAQLTNSQWPALSLEAGQTYCFSAWVRNDSPLAQRTITVVLTPRSSYDHFNPIASLTEVLAPPAQFLITDSWQEISHYFSVSQSEDNAALRFFFGDQLGAIRLDDIYLEVVDFNNHDPTLDFQPDQGDDQVAVTYGYNSQKQILGLIGEALPYQEAETITLLINDYPNNGVHSTQAFDPTGNTFDLPDQTYGLCTFLITDYSGLDHWFNVWAWYLNQATVSGIKFRWAEVPLPVASCQNQGGDITAELSYEYAAGNLRGLIFDTLYWQDITTVSVWVDGYGIYDTQPFNSLGNVLDLPDQTYQQANFFLTDTSGQDHWLDLWAWQWSGASLNFSWLNWSQLLN